MQLPLKGICVAILVFIPMTIPLSNSSLSGVFKRLSLIMSLSSQIPPMGSHHPRTKSQLPPWPTRLTWPGLYTDLTVLEHVEHIPTQGLWMCCSLCQQSFLPGLSMSHSLSSISSLFKSYPFGEANSYCST